MVKKIKSYGELLLKDFLINLGFNPKHNELKINRKVFDLVLENEKLILEVNGDQHYTNLWNGRKKEE